MKKQTQAQQGVNELSQRIEQLRAKKAALKTTEIELKCKIDAVEKRNKEQTRIEEKLRRMELDVCDKQRKEVTEFLETLQDVASSPKSSAKS